MLLICVLVNFALYLFTKSETSEFTAVIMALVLIADILNDIRRALVRLLGGEAK